ncbi:Ubiquitin carboxyl-terminal hydrolase [Melia azedarach]|uniref:Ubiquitin carboxyl-terminal hydrolase n=1 Tax=Melia azedarach TaxID=155640 RepID=A0ACC1WRG3_MELAZ|nr:Ubiquitin carboxyl-terminal hydrolase [Melia azedarach]
MHVTGDLGFSSLVLGVSLVFPVIAFIIRRKWRLAAARREEIKRLLILASEEDARAEFEASLGYGTVSVQQSYQCAVCFSPTTTRCARCKAVRYCSGKCQIVHWRQGHKDECHPPLISHEINDVGDSISQKVAEQDQSEVFGDRFKHEDRLPPKPIEISSEESPLSNTCSSPEVPHRKDNEIEDEFHEDGEGASSTYESSDASFSGFSTSHTSSETSDDVSVCESISSNESEKLDGPLSADISLARLETASSVKNLDQTQPLSPKFARLVDSINNFTKLNQVNQTISSYSEKGQCTSGSSDLGVRHTPKGSKTEKSASSDFWGKTLEAKMDSGGNSAESNSNGGSNSKLSDSRSNLLFSFDLSTPSLSAKSSEVKGVVADDALPASLGSSRHTDGVALSGNRNADAPQVNDSPSLNLKSPSHAVNGTKSSSHMLKSREVESSVFFSSYVPPPSSVGRDSISSDTSNINSGKSLSSEKSNHVASSAMLPHSESSASNGRNGLKTSLWKAVDQFRGPKMSKQCSLGVGSETAGRYSDKGLFSYELFVKLYNWNKVELQPCGLINCGNSCYANSVLQCLAFTPPLTAYFLQGLHSRDCPKKEWCFTCELESLILKAKDGKSPLSPVGILSQLQNIGSQLGNGREEDAHEFLRYAIDTMQSVCIKESEVNASGPLEEETTLIGLTFGGYLRSKIKCMKCQGKSERQERMMDLTVEIDGDIGSLEEGLRRFTGTEILDGENKYQCSRCKSYEQAKKKLTIAEAPNILTIALKRFQSGKFGKLNKPIQFPEILDLAPYMSGTSDKLPIYRLYGVVVHLDIMNAAFSGHYVCYVKSTQNKWFKVDDSVVAAVEREKVLKEGAYMLLYARCSPRAPRLIRNSIISHDVRNKVTLPSQVTGKSTMSKLRSPSTQSSVVQFHPGIDPSDGQASIETFYSRFHRLQRILEEDSSSDSSSLVSSNSDEGSCSTESTRDSSSADDISDFIFGDSGCGWNSPWRSSSDSDTPSSSSSSSLFYSRHSSLANSIHYVSSCPETSRIQADCIQPGMDCDRLRGRRPSRSNGDVDLEGRGSDPFLHSDQTKQCRKLASSSCRETDSERLGRVSPFNDVKSSVIFRKSTTKSTD